MNSASDSNPGPVSVYDELIEGSYMDMPKESLPPLIFEPEEAEVNFRPDMHAACYCTSGKLFGSCCGSPDAIRLPPYGLFMFENYLDEETVKKLRDFADQRDGQRLMVIDDDKSTPENIVKVYDERRVTERVDLGERQQEVNDIIQTAFVDLADKCVGKSLDWFEKPSLMRYHEGGFYVRHADSENMDPDTCTWHKVIDRDLSMLIYLNNDYEGGELSFYNLNYQVRPRAGAAVMFPSGHRYLHQAETVTSGVRYAIVSWASVSGVAKIATQPLESAILLD